MLVVDEAFNCLHANALAKELFWPDTTEAKVLPCELQAIISPFIDQLFAQAETVLTTHFSLHSQVYKADFVLAENQA